MDPIREWVERERREWILFEIAHIALGLGGGVVILYLTYLLLYFLTWIGTVGWVSLSSGELMVFSGLWLLLVVWAAAVADHEESESLAVRMAGEAQRGEGFSFPTSYGFRMNPIATVLGMAAFLYVGPRMIRGAWKRWAPLARLRRLDQAGCAEVIRLLLIRPGRVELGELSEGRPDLDVPGLLPDLEALRAVTTLASEPPGLVLSGRVRAELLAIMPGDPFVAGGFRRDLAP